MVPGPASDDQSMAVVGWLSAHAPWLAATLGPLANLAVRKCAHFVEYACLGLLVGRALGPVGEGRLGSWTAVAIAAGTVVAAIDEAIQLTVPGRSGQLSDVILDGCGVTAGVVLSLVLGRFLAKRSQRNPRRGR